MWLTNWLDLSIAFSLMQTESAHQNSCRSSYRNWSLTLLLTDNVLSHPQEVEAYITALISFLALFP